MVATVASGPGSAAGGRIGKYEVVKPLAAGDSARVLLCRDGGRDVAVKVFAVSSPRLLALMRDGGSEVADRLRRRFVAEAKLADRFRHPGIVAILEVAELGDGTPYFAMPYLPEGLADALRKKTPGWVPGAPLPPETPRPLPLDRAVAVLRQLLGALAEVHRAGVVHRDIKPDNVRFDAAGAAVLCDFSVARTPWGGFTPIRPRFGAPPFVSPEQAANSADVDPRSDLYSVGVLGYLMLTGRFPGRAGPAPRRADPRISEPVSAAVMQAIEAERDRRPADAAAMLALLGAA